MAQHDMTAHAGRTDWSREITPTGSGHGYTNGAASGNGNGFTNGYADGNPVPYGGEGSGAVSVHDVNNGLDRPVPDRRGETGGADAFPTADGCPDLCSGLPDDVIEAPTTMEEVYRGSLKALLLRNVGNYVVATFLIGTQTTVSWEGILYDVGNDYLAIYQSGRDQYIVSDLYSLKYVEFYDTRRRAMCDALLSQEARG